jgi:transposase
MLISDLQMLSREELYAQNLALRAELANLQAQVAWFQRQMFGTRSEKLPVDVPAQGKLGLAETPQREQPKQTVTYERRTVTPEKRPIPAEVFANVPVVETVELVPEEVKADPNAFEQISEERTFEVELIGPKLVKREIVRPKFRRKGEREQAPVIAPALPRVAAGGYASAGLIAYIVISKYQHHLPLYRLEAMSAQWGAQLSRKTMAEWVRIAADWAEPIYKLMLKELLAGQYLQCDETPVKFIDPDEKGHRAQQGYLWVVSTPGGDVVFDWRLSRRHGELTTLLSEDYVGLLQSDGYEAYDAYAAKRQGVIRVGCWAHARRKFFEAQQDNPRIAQAALRMIARMYRREREWDERQLEPEQRLAARLEWKTGIARTVASLKRLAVWARQRVLPKSNLGKACDYLLSQYESLVQHLRFGQTKLDNNLVENAIRPSCIGKKNWLFIGHPDAGQRSAILYSLIVSCQRHGKEPLAYLKNLLTRLPGMTNQDDLRPLLPVNWQPVQPA